MAANSHATTSAIINREVSETLPAAAQGALPKESSIRRTIQRERRKNLPPLPKMHQNWKSMENGEKLQMERTGKYLMSASKVKGFLFTHRRRIFCICLAQRHGTVTGLSL